MSIQWHRKTLLSESRLGRGREYKAEEGRGPGLHWDLKSSVYSQSRSAGFQVLPGREHLNQNAIAESSEVLTVLMNRRKGQQGNFERHTNVFEGTIFAPGNWRIGLRKLTP